MEYMTSTIDNDITTFIISDDYLDFLNSENQFILLLAGIIIFLLVFLIVKSFFD